MPLPRSLARLPHPPGPPLCPESCPRHGAGSAAHQPRPGPRPEYAREYDAEHPPSHPRPAPDQLDGPTPHPTYDYPLDPQPYDPADADAGRWPHRRPEPGLGREVRDSLVLTFGVLAVLVAFVAVLERVFG